MRGAPGGGRPGRGGIPGIVPGGGPVTEGNEPGGAEKQSSQCRRKTATPGVLNNSPHPPVSVPPWDKQAF